MEIKIHHIRQPGEWTSSDAGGKLALAVYAAATLGTLNPEDHGKLFESGGGRYWLAGIIETGKREQGAHPQHVIDAALEYAYERSQHGIHAESWHRTAGAMTVIDATFGKPRRSSMVGDVFELPDGQLYRVGLQGFDRIERSAHVR